MRIEIDEKKILDFYNKANAARKQLIDELLREYVLEFDYTEIKTYEDACGLLGIKPIDFEGMNDVLGNNNFPMLEPHEIAYKKLATIAKALNFGWCPNWADFDEFKYYLACHIVKHTGAKRGVVIENLNEKTDYVGLNNKILCAGLLACKNRKTAIYFGEQFKDLWEEYLLPKRNVL